jgi:hypothetical protein
MGGFESSQEGLFSYVSPEAEAQVPALHTIGGTKKVKVRGRTSVEMAFVLAGCALNLLRIAKLAPPETGAVRA